MCTVTFIPQSTGFVFTSNRDEALERGTIPPQVYKEGTVSLLYPKDEVAGGSWIGISSLNRLVCLLNGGFIAHKRATHYSLSRGVVVKDFLKGGDILKTIELYKLMGVEPFTLLIIDWDTTFNLFELVWDGNQKHLSKKPWRSTIWSSSLLYSPAIKKERERWFASFLEEQVTIDHSAMLHFHKVAGNGDIENNLVMKRSYVSTKSITQVVCQNQKAFLHYEDLQTQTSLITSI